MSNPYTYKTVADSEYEMGGVVFQVGQVIEFTHPFRPDVPKRHTITHFSKRGCPIDPVIAVLDTSYCFTATDVLEGGITYEGVDVGGN